MTQTKTAQDNEKNRQDPLRWVASSAKHPRQEVDHKVYHLGNVEHVGVPLAKGEASSRPTPEQARASSRQRSRRANNQTRKMQQKKRPGEKAWKEKANK